MDANGAYLSIENCPDGILTCRFNFEPQYESIFALGFLIAGLFIIAPLLISIINTIFFSKILCGKTLGQVMCCCCRKKKPKIHKLWNKSILKLNKNLLIKGKKKKILMNLRSSKKNKKELSFLQSKSNRTNLFETSKKESSINANSFETLRFSEKKNPSSIRYAKPKLFAKKKQPKRFDKISLNTFTPEKGRLDVITHSGIGSINTNS